MKALIELDNNDSGPGFIFEMPGGHRCKFYLDTIPQESRRHLALAWAKAQLAGPNQRFERDVKEELAAAREAHAPMHSLHEGYAVLLEEVDELKAEIFRKQRSVARIYDELIQVAAMAQRMAEDCIGVSP